MNNLTLNSNVYNRDYRFVPTQSVPAPVQMRAAAPPQDEFSAATTAVGAAGLLRLAQYGLEKLSGVCSAALMAGKEFAPREDAKETLGAKANLKALKKNYLLAWMTYVLAGIGTGIAAKLMITKD